LKGPNPQSYETGIKEIWRIKPENHMPGAWCTHGLAAGPDDVRRRLDLRPEGQLRFDRLRLGLDYDNPYTDPHDLMQRWKTHRA